MRGCAVSHMEIYVLRVVPGFYAAVVVLFYGAGQSTTPHTRPSSSRNYACEKEFLLFNFKMAAVYFYIYFVCKTDGFIKVSTGRKNMKFHPF